MKLREVLSTAANVLEQTAPVDDISVFEAVRIVTHKLPTDEKANAIQKTFMFILGMDGMMASEIGFTDMSLQQRLTARYMFLSFAAQIANEEWNK